MVPTGVQDSNDFRTFEKCSTLFTLCHIIAIYCLSLSSMISLGTSFVIPLFCTFYCCLPNRKRIFWIYATIYGLFSIRTISNTKILGITFVVLFYILFSTQYCMKYWHSLGQNCEWCHHFKKASLYWFSMKDGKKNWESIKKKLWKILLREMCKLTKNQLIET